ncbi:hypothetical protein DFH08DRAFT_825279 [Mycena albidolilacea]|uniref:Uncharacterized protein n=1 Tax=Mycena albidolilacea TaxID=1033008 RepID=A0AAD6Z2S1_9AGAR|nr:hypothetical protein DFH08DRAFT_825279 [Mycena albidolilacea]
MPVVCQECPSSTPGDGTSYLTTYTLNMQYGCVGYQSASKTLSQNTVGVSCKDIGLFVRQFKHWTVSHLMELVSQHRLHSSAHRTTLVSIFTAHSCDMSCPAHDCILIFRKLLRPRDVQHARNKFTWQAYYVVFDNAPRADDPGTISTFPLNKLFEFSAIGDAVSMQAAYGSSNGHTICECSDIGKFGSMSLYLTVAQLSSTIAQAHFIASGVKKSSLLHAIYHHKCTDSCALQPLVFIRSMHDRPGPFTPQIIVFRPENSLSPTLSSMDDLTVLPVMLNNDIQVGPRDRTDFISTYLLNYSYNFVEIITALTLQSLHRADMGMKFVAVHTTSISGFVPMYQYLQNKELRATLLAHGIHPGKTKPFLLERLLEHQFGTDCLGRNAIFLFTVARKVREGVACIRTVDKVRVDEHARKDRYEQTKAVKAAVSTGGPTSDPQIGAVSPVPGVPGGPLECINSGIDAQSISVPTIERGLEKSVIPRVSFGQEWPQIAQGFPPGRVGFNRSRDRFAITLGMAGFPLLKYLITWVARFAAKPTNCLSAQSFTFTYTYYKN